MERLTMYDTFKKRYQINNDRGVVRIDDLGYVIGEAADRLAAYEDTGLAPEEVAKIKDTDAGKQFFEWIEASGEGRLVVLPCKVGDMVYRIAEGVTPGKFIVRMSFDYWMIPLIGSAVFLTREEAEAALAKEAGT